MLIANGAAVNAKLENGQTPLDWAVQPGAADMAEFFRSQGGKKGVSAKDAEKKQETDFTDLQDHCPTTAHGSRGNRFRRSELDSEASTE
ncbi:MAG: ankyrin repeat domain-containing protein [Verrucomicrobiales bacterium]|nr:ankyrin repeat domain-containing protein [Verrucomicrobiales bacterium]